MADSDLTARVAAIEQWQKERQAQQIVFPLDINSQVILQTYFLSVVGNISFTNQSGQQFNETLMKQNGIIYAVSTLSSLIPFTVNTSTSFVTVGIDAVTRSQGMFANGDKVHMETTGTLPSPLTNAGEYIVLNATAGGTSFQVADPSTPSTPITITDNGTGVQYLYGVT